MGIDINSEEYKLATLRREVEGGIIIWNEKYYLIWKLNKSLKCQLMDRDYIHYSGTPDLKNVDIIAKRQRVYFNAHFYILVDSQDIISCSTGKIVYKNNSQQRRDILFIFKRELRKLNQFNLNK